MANHALARPSYDRPTAGRAGFVAAIKAERDGAVSTTDCEA
jgi:hypothetical protein